MKKILLAAAMATALLSTAVRADDTTVVPATTCTSYSIQDTVVAAKAAGVKFSYLSDQVKMDAIKVYVEGRMGVPYPEDWSIIKTVGVVIRDDGSAMVIFYDKDGCKQVSAQLSGFTLPMALII